VLPCPKNTWEMLVLDDNPGVRFVVFQHDVVPWLMLLNKIILQKPRIYLCINDSKRNTVYFSNKYTGLAVELLFVYEIRAYPITQILSFPHIDEFIIFVKILINTWLMGYFL